MKSREDRMVKTEVIEGNVFVGEKEAMNTAKYKLLKNKGGKMKAIPEGMLYEIQLALINLRGCVSMELVGYWGTPPSVPTLLFKLIFGTIYKQDEFFAIKNTCLLMFFDSYSYEPFSDTVMLYYHEKRVGFIERGELR